MRRMRNKQTHGENSGRKQQLSLGTSLRAVLFIFDCIYIFLIFLGFLRLRRKRAIFDRRGSAFEPGTIVEKHRAAAC